MSNSPTLTGLFLGAGASYELGMPLAWDLTKELKTWLTPEKFKFLNDTWKAQNGGYSERVVEDFIKILLLPELHYEAILGHLETQFRRRSPESSQYYGLYSWLVELIYFLLYFRHVRNTSFITKNIPFFKGIKSLAEKNFPLWVFSLNHDLMVECLAAEFNLPLHSGFDKNQITLPRRDKSGKIFGEIKAGIVTADQLRRSILGFAKPGEEGINLLKIHGALDVFTFRDGKDLLKLLPSKSTPTEIIESLRIANEELICPDNPSQKFRVRNEIIYADTTGKIQFLRRSLLAGAYKFDGSNNQVLPENFLILFKNYLNNLKKLVCLGYRFGDTHINNIIRKWLELNEDHHLEIVSPNSKNIPDLLLHLASQIKLIPNSASEYFDSEGNISRTRSELLYKRCISWVRRVGDKNEAEHQLKLFIKEHQTKMLNIVVERLKSFPIIDGKIDLKAIAESPDDLAKKWLSEEYFSIEQVLEDFTATRESK